MSAAAIGIDVGSATLKSVLVDAHGNMINSCIEPTRPRMGEQAAAQIERLTAKSGNNTGSSLPIVATGYGRRLVTSARECMTEITCHAYGIFRAMGHGGTLIDVGGQDSKVILIGERGQVIDFVMNDKCAAGTGRFLEHCAQRMGMTLDEFSDVHLLDVTPVNISSTCTVFAESEIISLLAEGVAPEIIACSLQRALTGRLSNLAKSVGIKPPLMMSGGVARNPVLRHFLGEALGYPVEITEHPQLMGAYGAALFALEHSLA